MEEATANPIRTQNPQLEYREIVAALSRENARLLFARQRASGIEIEVLTAERDMVEAADPKMNEGALASLYELDRLAILELETTEQRIENLESRMAAIVTEIADLQE